jgi:hypothetical protein
MSSSATIPAIGGPSLDVAALGGRMAQARRPDVAFLRAKQPDWVRVWQGCDILAWVALLFRNRFAVEPRYWHIAAIITVLAVVNTMLGLLERAIYGRIVRKTTIAEPPIFLIGHWRTGTTLLHELMICNERFGFPTTYQCIEPHHFLLTERLFSSWLRYLVPATRPMDNMPAALDRPQEDEMALCMLGTASPYSAMAFPNHSPGREDLLDLEPTGVRRWKQRFYRFLQRVTLGTGKRLVLKSPPHTARVKVLKEIFPNAIFIHIVRNPFEVFPSTVNLWRTLYRSQGLQTPTFVGLEEMVLSTYARMHEKLEDAKQTLPRDQYYELTYESLVKDPIGEIEKIYNYFRLPDFEASLPRLQKYVAAVKSYETNKYDLSAEHRALIAQRWGDVIQRYGYC